jgi:dUTP pyrophosphatase
MKIKLLDKRLDLPSYATEGSAAIDLRACSYTAHNRTSGNIKLDHPANDFSKPYTIYEGGTLLVGTGISVDLGDEGIELAGLVLPRSGLGLQGIILGNSVGLIDTDYQGEIKVNLWNRGKEPFTIKALDRIAQLMFVPYYKPILEVAHSFEPTDRGSNGFGSTGI